MASRWLTQARNRLATVDRQVPVSFAATPKVAVLIRTDPDLYVGQPFGSKGQLPSGRSSRYESIVHAGNDSPDPLAGVRRVTPEQVCGRCRTELPASGECGYC